MKTQLFTPKQTMKTMGFIAILLCTLFAFNPVNAQETAATERTIKGKVSDESGPLKDVNIIQDGTINGTVTNEKGEFTFPVKLSEGDVLLVSYLGYKTQKIIIDKTTNTLDIKLTEVSIEMIGALDAGKPYRSKRKN